MSSSVSGKTNSKQQGRLGRDESRYACFVSAPNFVDLSTITSSLEERSVRPVLVDEFSDAGGQVFARLHEAIDQVDFVICVLDGQRGNDANVLFELGFASARGLPVLILVAPGRELPSELASTLYIRAEAGNREAIDFALDHLLATLGDLGGEKETAQVQRSSATSQPIGVLADRLLEQLGNSASIKGQAAEQTVVNVVVSALRASGVSSVVPGPAQGGADLAIWSDDLSSSVGNPLLIEVKVNVTKSKDLMNASLQAFQYLQQSNARSAVVFYTRAPRSSLDITPAMYLPFVYVVELAGFLLDMKSASFPDLIRNLRNMFVHGVGR